MKRNVTTSVWTRPILTVSSVELVCDRHRPLVGRPAPEVDQSALLSTVNVRLGGFVV